MPSSLFTRHPLVLQTAYSELKRQAVEQPSLLVGTPGGIVVREVNERRFLYRQYYDAEGKKAADYIGAADDPVVKARAGAITAQIETTSALAKEGRLLAQHGYTRVNVRTEAVLSALANGGLFRGGALVIGSHAYGVLLNELGAAAAAFMTGEVDVARPRRLEIAAAPPITFEEMLASSCVPFTPIPPLARKGVSTSFSTKAKGSADRLRVDLLAPTRGETIETVAVPELEAHATTLPYLAYLLSNPLDVVVLGRTNIIPVKAPRPERFVWHKMLVSEQRNETTTDKRAKDIEQASVVFALLAEDAPDALEDALSKVPLSAQTKTLRGAKRVLSRLEQTKHERASALLSELLRACGRRSGRTLRR